MHRSSVIGYFRKFALLIVGLAPLITLAQGTPERATPASFDSLIRDGKVRPIYGRDLQHIEAVWLRQFERWSPDAKPLKQAPSAVMYKKFVALAPFELPSDTPLWSTIYVPRGVPIPRKKLGTNWIIAIDMVCTANSACTDPPRTRTVGFSDPSKQFVPHHKTEFRLGDGCDLRSLPRDAEVYAITTWHTTPRKQPAVQIDDRSASVPYDARLTVNRAGKDVVLLLLSNEPAVFDISMTPSTRLAAVITVTDSGAAVLGVPSSVPITINNFGRMPATMPCLTGSLQLEWPEAAPILDEFVRQITAGLPLRRLLRFDPVAIIGDPIEAGTTLTRSDERKLQDFAAPSQRPTGERGLDELVSQGAIRPINPSDVRLLWSVLPTQPAQAGTSPSARNPYIHAKYIALTRFVWPEGLYGGHSIEVVVPENVEAPIGNPGHSKAQRWPILCEPNGACRPSPFAGQRGPELVSDPGLAGQVPRR